VVKRGQVKFREERCKGCGLCIRACPKGIIGIGDKINPMGYPVAEVLEGEKCTGCALCAEMCPDIVITVFR
jgi:2-oxoglutarate ferredoxin oxidoreductase subunit delta